jgi:hypothetical protein
MIPPRPKHRQQYIASASCHNTSAIKRSTALTPSSTHIRQIHPILMNVYDQKVHLFHVTDMRPMISIPRRVRFRVFPPTPILFGTVVGVERSMRGRVGVDVVRPGNASGRVPGDGFDLGSYELREDPNGRAEIVSVVLAAAVCSLLDLPTWMWICGHGITTPYDPV